MYHPVFNKNTRYMKKPENMTYEHEKNQSIERDPDITEMIELAYNDFKIAIINIFKD